MKSRLRRSTWLLLLPVVAGLLITGAAPSQAAGESWRILNPFSVGCTTWATHLMMETTGLDGSKYTGRTLVTAGGKTYMNELDIIETNTTFTWSLRSNMTYGSVSNPGTWPIPADQQVRVRVTIERPKGTVLSSWTMVMSSCASSTVRYNGPTADDVDEDLVPVVQDRCPNVKAFTENGCPLRARRLSLTPKTGPRRVLGTLAAPGFPALAAGRTVYIWKVRPGPDLKVRTRTTNGLGKFSATVPKGRYYATSPGVIVPSAGQTSTTTSPVVRVR